MEQVPEIVRLDEVPTAVIRGTVSMEEIAGFYDRVYGEVAATVARQGATPQAAFGLYLKPPQDTFELEAGFVVDRPIERDGEVMASLLPAGRAARLTHLGPYDALGDSWERLMGWIGEQGKTQAGPMWEVYVTEPTPESDPATLRTDLFCVVQ